MQAFIDKLLVRHALKGLNKVNERGRRGTDRGSSSFKQGGLNPRGNIGPLARPSIEEVPGMRALPLPDERRPKAKPQPDKGRENANRTAPASLLGEERNQHRGDLPGPGAENLTHGKEHQQLEHKHTREAQVDARIIRIDTKRGERREGTDTLIQLHHGGDGRHLRELWKRRRRKVQASAPLVAPSLSSIVGFLLRRSGDGGVEATVQVGSITEHRVFVVHNEAR